MSDKIGAANLSNPRRHAEIEGWPIGRNQRATAVFSVEAVAGKGERVTRTTTGKPKATTYAEQCAITDGDDGKTYILKSARDGGGFVEICAGDMKHSLRHVWATSEPNEYSNLRSLLDKAVNPDFWGCCSFHGNYDTNKGGGCPKCKEVAA
jgi:hypothetical protein